VLNTVLPGNRLAEEKNRVLPFGRRICSIGESVLDHPQAHPQARADPLLSNIQRYVRRSRARIKVSRTGFKAVQVFSRLRAETRGPATSHAKLSRVSRASTVSDVGFLRAQVARGLCGGRVDATLANVLCLVFASRRLGSWIPLNENSLPSQS
jgi:hypothetical protein